MFCSHYQVVHVLDIKETKRTLQRKMTAPHKANSNPTNRRKVTAVVLFIFVCLIFIPLGVLGAAIDWPNNLSEDAVHNLPLLLEQQTSAFWGYFIYLIYSILFFPMAFMMGSVLANGNSDSLLWQIGNGFAALSAVTRSIGLSRWLFAMPTLARIYVDPNTSETSKEAIAISYEMLNGYGGGIGEVLGVSIFASLWVTCASIMFLKSTVWPSWMGWVGFLVAIDLAINLLEMSILNLDVGINLTISVVVLHLWLLLAGLLFIHVPFVRCLQKKANDPDDAGEEEIGKEDEGGSV